MNFKSIIPNSIHLLAILLFTSCEPEVIEKPTALTLSEGFENPIGFYDATPTFSWQLPVSADVSSQTAYQIVAASSPDLLPDNADLWDSKKQETSQSTWVKYKGEPLTSRQKVYWQVKYWNQDGETSAWSETQNFELGLLNNSDWQAEWVGLNTAKDSIRGRGKVLIHKPQYLRKGFEVSNTVESARLYITSKGVFDVSINGTNVSDDAMSPGFTSYDKRIETLTYDVTDLIASGENAIGVELAAGWYSGRLLWGTTPWDNTISPKVLAQLELTMKDGTKKQLFRTAAGKE